MKSKFEDVLQDVEEAESLSETAEALDAGFDGGEFSGPAHEERLDREVDAICEKHGWRLEEFWITRMTVDAAEKGEG